VLGSPVVDEEMEEEIGFQNAVGEGDLSRFDKRKKSRNHNDNHNHNNNRNRNDRQKSHTDRAE